MNRDVYGNPWANMSNTMVEDQFHIDESQDFHRAASPILQSESQETEHTPYVPIVGAMSNIALWNHEAFIMVSAT